MVHSRSFMLAAAICCMGTATALAADCASKDAFGTSRVLPVSTRAFAAVGAAQKAHGDAKKSPLPLQAGEVVLTFDDGPVRGTTPKILDILERECIRATFFMIGKRAETAPEILARMKAAGHTLASHSWSHARLTKLPPESAIDDIRKGYEAVERAADGAPRPDAAPRFFRFPEWAASPELFDFTRAHAITAVGADISPADWRGNPPEVTLDRLRKLLDRSDRGIIVLHDNQANTVALLPALLAELKARGLRIVHLSPAQ